MKRKPIPVTDPDLDAPDAELRLKFSGDSGRKPSAEARRYVYAVMASALETDLIDPEGWVRGGLGNEFDDRRAKSAARKVITELRRKAKAP